LNLQGANHSTDRGEPDKTEATFKNGVLSVTLWLVSSVVKPVQKLEYPPEDDPIVDHNCGQPNG